MIPDHVDEGLRALEELGLFDGDDSPLQSNSGEIRVCLSNEMGRDILIDWCERAPAIIEEYSKSDDCKESFLAYYKGTLEFFQYALAAGITEDMGPMANLLRDIPLHIAEEMDKARAEAGSATKH